MVQVITTGFSNMPIVYSIQSPVGRGKSGASHPDQALVRWCLRNLYPPGSSSPAAPLCNALNPNGGCDDSVVAAIEAVQKQNFPALVDGNVSPLRQGHWQYHMMALLMAGVRRRHFTIWPMLWDAPEMPPVLRGALKDALIGNTLDVMPLK